MGRINTQILYLKFVQSWGNYSVPFTTLWYYDSSVRSMGVVGRHINKNHPQSLSKNILKSPLNWFYPSLQKHNVVLKKIESRPSKCKNNYYDLYIEIDQNGTKESDVKFIIQDLEKNAENVVLQNKETGNYCYYYSQYLNEM